MNSYQNVQSGNPLFQNESAEKLKKLTWAEFFLMVFFAAYMCDYTNRIILYGGFAAVFITTLISVVYNGEAGHLRFPAMCSRLLIFSLYSLMSFMWAIEPGLVLRYSVITMMSTLLTIIMVAYFIDRGSETAVIITIATTGVVLAGYVIFSYGGFSAFYSSAMEKNARLGGEIHNENVIGMQCAYSSIVLFYYALFHKKRLFYLIFLLPAVVAAASGSRKAVIAVILGVIFLIYFKQQENKTVEKYLRYIILAFVLLVAVIYVLRLPIMHTFVDRMDLMMDTYGGRGTVGSSADVRNEMIVIAFKQFLFKPFFGIGLRNSEILNQIKLNVSAYSHNDYLELLVNGGIVGFVLYYSIYAYLVRKHIELLKKESDPQTVISFVLMIIFLVMNWGNVTYYGSLSTYLYLILWITHVELKKQKGII